MNEDRNEIAGFRDTEFNRGSGWGWERPTNSWDWHAYRIAVCDASLPRERSGTRTEVGQLLTQIFCAPFSHGLRSRICVLGCALWMF
jgi:hypothetical protein